MGQSKTLRRKKSKEIQENRGRSLIVSKIRERNRMGQCLDLTKLSQEVSNVIEHQKNTRIYF